jgi:hypothetical protein
VANTLVFAGVALAGVAVGAVVGRWWALLLAFLVPVGFIPAGEDPDAMPYWEIALYAFTPLVLLGLAVGVAARKTLGAT